MRDATSSSYPQSTGRFDEPTRTSYERDPLAERLAAMVGGAALVAYAIACGNCFFCPTHFGDGEVQG